MSIKGFIVDKETEPTFSTKRLDVWEIISPDSGDRHGRRMYIAIIKTSDRDWPGVAVSLSVWPANGNFVDWIQTSDPVRGNGYGGELIEGVESHLGSKLTVYAVSESGGRLEKRVNLRHRFSSRTKSRKPQEPST